MQLFLTFAHIGFVSFWLGGALYLPQVFRRHSVSSDAAHSERLFAMARRLYVGIMTPGAIIAVVLGGTLLSFGFEGGWLPVKLSLVAVLVLFHLYCGRVLLKVEKGKILHGPRFYGSLTLLPVILLLGIVTLAVVKPF